MTLSLPFSSLMLKLPNERFTSAGLGCRLNLKHGNFTLSFGGLRQKIAPKSVPHVQHDYFSSFNQSNRSFVVLSLQFLLSFLKLPNEWFTAAGSRCRQNLKCEKFTSSFRRLRQQIFHQKACRTIIFPHPTNQIIDLRCCRSRSCRCF